MNKQELMDQMNKIYSDAMRVQATRDESDFLNDVIDNQFELDNLSQMQVSSLVEKYLEQQKQQS